MYTLNETSPCTNPSRNYKEELKGNSGMQNAGTTYN